MRAVVLKVIGLFLLIGYSGDYESERTKSGLMLSEYRGNKTELSVPKRYSTVRHEAFKNASYLTSISLNENIKNIETATFLYCEKLSAINVSPKNEYYSSLDGVLFNKEQTILLQYPMNKRGAAYIVPDTVREIGEQAFRGNNFLETLIINETLETLDSGAFFDCSGLKEVYVNKDRPPFLYGASVFGDQHPERIIYVKKGTLEYYLENPYWAGYKDSIREALSNAEDY